jgi:hypothetical protein
MSAWSAGGGASGPSAAPLIEIHIEAFLGLVEEHPTPRYLMIF